MQTAEGERGWIRGEVRRCRQQRVGARSLDSSLQVEEATETMEERRDSRRAGVMGSEKRRTPERRLNLEAYWICGQTAALVTPAAAPRVVPSPKLQVTQPDHPKTSHKVAYCAIVLDWPHSAQVYP